MAKKWEDFTNAELHDLAVSNRAQFNAIHAEWQRRGARPKLPTTSRPNGVGPLEDYDSMTLHRMATSTDPRERKAFEAIVDAYGTSSRERALGGLQ